MNSAAGRGNEFQQRGESGALGEIRTHDLCLRRAALYPLSYKRAVAELVPREGFEPTHP